MSRLLETSPIWVLVPFAIGAGFAAAALGVLLYRAFAVWLLGRAELARVRLQYQAAYEGDLVDPRRI